MDTTRLQVSLVCAVLLGGCSAEGGAPAPSIPEWTVEPQLRIGSVDDPEYSLTWFRRMAVGADGTMYTAHPMEQIVRVFRSDGTAAGHIGGRGDGPGEFQNLFNLGWVADTLWLLDANGFRFNQFNASGALLGTFSVPFTMTQNPREIQPPRADGLLFDGTVHGSPPAFSSQIASGTLNHDLPLLMTRGGEVTDTLPAVAFGNNQWAVRDPDNPDRGGMYMPQPWADGPLWSFAANERALLILDRNTPADSASAGFTVTKLGFGGDTVFSRRYPARTVPVTEAMVDSVLDAFEEGMGDRQFLGQTPAGLRAWAVTSLYVPAFRPAATAMVAGRDGTIWVGLGPDGLGRDLWMVLNADGTPAGALGLPPGVTVLAADADHVWGSQSDDFDVPYLVRFGVVH